MHWAQESLKKVEQSRSSRLNPPPLAMEDAAAQSLLTHYHPDFKSLERDVRVGAQAGTLRCLPELAELLEADSPLPKTFDPQPSVTTDVLIIGGGGAGASAALALEDSGLNVTLATKLRLGDANTVMAEGGIQAAIGPEDSPHQHFADAFVGGHGNNRADLLRVLVEEGGATIGWLTELGTHFDRTEDGKFRLKPGGGTSVPRVLACRDFTGLEIMRVLKDAVRHGPTQLLERHAAVELCDDGAGQVTGAVLWNTETRELLTVSARAVLLATGGSGQLRLQSFPTSNHMGATGDGLVLAYRQGAELLHLDSFQYHPTGAVFPEALAGQLVTESIRSSGAQLVNAEGERFIDELTFRDRVAAAIIREVAEGRGVATPTGRHGVWLDTPLVEELRGEGTIPRQFPGLIHRFKRYGMDPRKTPVLVYPTLHYQNGGVAIEPDGQTGVKGLWAAGEVTGGLHGTNRLMGNSLLDIIVFGRRAGESIADALPERGNLTLNALNQFRKGRDEFAGLSEKTAPLLYPKLSDLKFELTASQASEGSSQSIFSQGGDSAFEPPDPFGSS